MFHSKNAQFKRTQKTWLEYLLRQLNNSHLCLVEIGWYFYIMLLGVRWGWLTSWRLPIFCP